MPQPSLPTQQHRVRNTSPHPSLVLSPFRRYRGSNQSALCQSTMLVHHHPHHYLPPVSYRRRVRIELSFSSHQDVQHSTASKTRLARSMQKRSKLADPPIQPASSVKPSQHPRGFRTCTARSIILHHRPKNRWTRTRNSPSKHPRNAFPHPARVLDLGMSPFLLSIATASCISIALSLFFLFIIWLVFLRLQFRCPETLTLDELVCVKTSDVFWILNLTR